MESHQEWALIAVSAVNGSAQILAASPALTTDCREYESIEPDDMCIGLFDGEAGVAGPGVYLWTGLAIEGGVVTYRGRLRPVYQHDEIVYWLRLQGQKVVLSDSPYGQQVESGVRATPFEHVELGVEVARAKHFHAAADSDGGNCD